MKMKTKKSLLLLLLGIFLLCGCTKAEREPVETTAESSVPQLEIDLSEAVILRNVIQVQQVSEYIGVYMEDGTDEVVSDVMMMVVKNLSSDSIQYAEIHLPVGEETARFTVTALPAGGTAILLEQSRMQYREDGDYDLSKAECVNLAGFDKELTLRENLLEIQCLDGALNVRNISGQDITGDIVICYKNYENGVYYGGIAYRIRIEGGLKADELRQLMLSHFHQPGSQLIFVDIAE